MADLASAIGAPPPLEFDVLGAAERAALAETVERAAARRSAHINRAIEDSLRHIPALIRGPVKRALGI